jgi:mannose-6-phosphate isomerase
MDTPLRFEPFLRPMVWGGRSLAERLDKNLPTAERYGESWEISDHPIHRSVVASGPRAGQSIRTLMETEANRLLGPAADRHGSFPWLCKFLDACDWLSVQVHPDKEKVRKLWPGEGSKTEAWLVIDAQPGSRIYAGLLPNVDEKRLREANRAGKIVECLHSFQPQPGDCIFLPAGTVHAVGGGVLIAEIQQTSDATFRLYDWDRLGADGRPRQLHLEEAMASIHWNQGPVHPVRCAGFSRSGEPLPPGHRQQLATCPYFRLDYIRASEPFICGGENRLELLAVLDGKGKLATDRSEEQMHRGQVWLLPASMPNSWCRPEGTIHVMHCVLP